jgi:hypothetical protein
MSTNCQLLGILEVKCFGVFSTLASIKYLKLSFTEKQKMTVF